MSELTSAEIKWEDGKNFAVVDNRNNRAIEQYETYNGLLLDLDEHGYFHKFNDYQYRYNADFFYVVERENKKTVVDAVNFMRAKTQLCNLFYDKESMELTYNYKFDNEGYKVCTVGEYDKCVKEMSEAAWMNDGEPQSYKAYKADYYDMQDDKPVEWKNGDECVYKNDKCFFVGLMPIIQEHYEDGLDCFIQHESGCPLIAKSCELSKPESPEQKAKREREEKAVNLYYLSVSHEKDPIEWECVSIEKQLYYNLVDAGVQLPKESK